MVGDGGRVLELGYNSFHEPCADQTLCYGVSMSYLFKERMAANNLTVHDIIWLYILNYLIVKASTPCNIACLSYWSEWPMVSKQNHVIQNCFWLHGPSSTWFGIGKYPSQWVLQIYLVARRFDKYLHTKDSISSFIDLPFSRSVD